jgi:hypothetical protein
MSQVTAAGSGIHPSPHRDRVGLFALWFGMFGAAAAWITQLVGNYMLVNLLCYRHQAPLSRELERGAGVWPAVLALNLIAMVVAVVATFTAYRTWRLTREEHPGDAQHALDVGEGRTRFMGLVGIMTSGGFVAAIVFDTIVLLIVPQCGM